MWAGSRAQAPIANLQTSSTIDLPDQTQSRRYDGCASLSHYWSTNEFGYLLRHWDRTSTRSRLAQPWMFRKISTASLFQERAPRCCLCSPYIACDAPTFSHQLCHLSKCGCLSKMKRQIIENDRRSLYSAGGMQWLPGFLLRWSANFPMRTWSEDSSYMRLGLRSLQGLKYWNSSPAQPVHRPKIR